MARDVGRTGASSIVLRDLGCRPEEGGRLCLTCLAVAFFGYLRDFLCRPGHFSPPIAIWVLSVYDGLFANPSERPMTAFSFDCAADRKSLQSTCSDSNLEDYAFACRAIPVTSLVRHERSISLADILKKRVAFIASRTGAPTSETAH